MVTYIFLLCLLISLIYNKAYACMMQVQTLYIRCLETEASCDSLFALAAILTRQSEHVYVL